MLFLDNFEYYLEENSNQEDSQTSTAAALSCSERVKLFIPEIARCATNIKFLVTSSERVCFLRTMKPMHLIPFTEVESSKLVEKVSGEEISDRQFEILCEICSGIPLVLHTLASQLDLICLLDHFEHSIPEEVTKFLEKMKAVPEDGKIEVCLDFCFQRLTRQVQLTLLRLCLYRGLFTPGKAAKIFYSSESSEYDLRNNVLELGRRNLLHQQKSQDAPTPTIKYTFLTVIRQHFKLKAKQEYHDEIQHARSLLIDYLIFFLKETFKVFLRKNSVKSAIEEFSAEKENVIQLVEWIDEGEVDEERVKKCIDVFNVAGEMLAKMMTKFNYRNVFRNVFRNAIIEMFNYRSAKKWETCGDGLNV